MWCNNKYTLEESSEDKKLIGWLLNYVDNKIKSEKRQNDTCDEKKKSLIIIEKERKSLAKS